MTEFDPEDIKTWPLPGHAVFTRHADGSPYRIDDWGNGWLNGFEKALRMADHFYKTNEWDTTK